MSEKSLTVKPADTAVARQEPNNDVLAFIERASADKNFDVDKFKALLEFKEREDKRQAEVAFNQAMARLQPILPMIDKKGRIEFTSQKTGVTQMTPFARYEDIYTAIRPLLHAEGFSLSFDSELGEKGQVYHGTLSHCLGHSKRASMILPADTSGSKNSIQAIGSTVSYAKRYLVGMLLNIVTRGEDNDGASVGFIDERQVGVIVDMFSACEMGVQAQTKFLEFMNAKSVSEIQARDYEKAITALRQKEKQVREGRK